MLIRRNPSDELEELFRLKADPSPHQPDNAIVFLRPRGRQRFKRDSPRKYDQLNGALKASYNDDTASFARHMKQRFKNSTQIGDFPQPTAEACMLLLFDIARRLVKTGNPSGRKEAFDVLAIGSAIARLINLLELRKATFDEVFLPKERFHCFTGKPEDTRKAIEEMNVTIKNTNCPRRRKRNKMPTASRTSRIVLPR